MANDRRPNGSKRARQFHVAMVTDVDQLAALEAEWTALLKESSADTRSSPRPGCGAGGALVSLAPLCMRRLSARGVLWVRELAFLASGEVKSDYLDVVVQRADERRAREALVKAVVASPGSDLLCLEGLPEDWG